MRTKKAPLPAPEVYRYHDYVAFLKDWLAYRKASQPGFSLRRLARQAQLAVGYLPMVLGHKRPLTAKALGKLAPFLGLSASGQSFLESLVTLGTSGIHETRRSALGRMGRFQLYQKHNPRETEVYRYLTHWYYIAIREMAGLADFRLDPQWIQTRLCEPVPLKELKDALGFLMQNGFLRPDGKGGAQAPDAKALDCTGDVFRVALSQFHRETFELAARSIEKVPRDQRHILGHTFPLSAPHYEKAKAIMEEAIEKIRALGEAEKNGDAVYHLELALFPMTRGRS